MVCHAKWEVRLGLFPSLGLTFITINYIVLCTMDEKKCYFHTAWLKVEGHLIETSFYSIVRLLDMLLNLLLNEQVFCRRSRLKVRVFCTCRFQLF